MKYSVIIPVFNEQDAVQGVYVAVKNIMLKLAESYEVLFIDDGSTDQTLTRLKRLAAGQGDIGVISLERHAGKAQALQAGFDVAVGDIYITMDGDGQDEPAEIPKLLEKMGQGYDVVCGWRHRRQDHFIRRASSWLAGRVRGALLPEGIHDVGCALRVFRKKDIEGLCLSRGFHRFFTFMIKKKGFKVGEVQVIHHSRKTGISKYGILNRLPQGLADLLLMMCVDLDKLMAGPCHYKIKGIYKSGEV